MNPAEAGSKHMPTTNTRVACIVVGIPKKITALFKEKLDNNIVTGKIIRTIALIIYRILVYTVHLFSKIGICSFCPDKNKTLKVGCSSVIPNAI